MLGYILFIVFCVFLIRFLNDIDSERKENADNPTKEHKSLFQIAFKSTSNIFKDINQAWENTNDALEAGLNEIEASLNNAKNIQDSGKNENKHTNLNQYQNHIVKDSEYSSDTQVKYKTHKISSKSRNKQKGDKYELQIGKYYQKKGYKVYFKGINEGLYDEGIDLIAYRGKEALLIQCKNWEHSQVKQGHLRKFLGDCTAYLKQNQKIFAKKNMRRVFVTSCKNMNYGVKKFIVENNIEYKVIPYLG
ncbi:restriction endonuclease [Helicobacter sp. UBA3407]|uniref:restriction endonuclease n=2 Tax=Helicobacteraceae TaxID=72293 RepID=UPI0026181EA1|nr:restriction endonuclease [Helicobacter sp. UBA3407]